MDEAREPSEAAPAVETGWIGAIGVLLFSFALALYSGLRGVFPLDQSIVFDAAWRVHEGQVPYRDFCIPFGPVSFGLQAALFQLLGVHWTAYAVGAAIQNTLGAISSGAIVRRLHPQTPWAAVAAAALTGAWLYAPFGTIYPEQTAFCVILVGLALVFAAQPPCGLASVPGDAFSTWKNAAFLAAAGLCAAAAILSKHNAGLLGLGVFGVAILTSAPPSWGRRTGALGWFALGLATGAAAFTAWLFLYSDPAAFYEQVIVVPGRAGAERLFGGGAIPFIRGLFTGKGSEVVRTILCTAGLLFVATAAFAWTDPPAADPHRRRTVAAAAVGTALLFTQNLFSLSSHNGGANEKPFLGLIFALTIAMLHFLRERFRPATDAADSPSLKMRIPRSAVFAAIGASAAASLLLGAGAPILGTLLAAVALDGLGAVAPPAKGGLAERFRLAPPPRALSAAVGTAFVYLLGMGSMISGFRLVHESFQPLHRAGPLHYSSFDQTLAPAGLAGLHWGLPSRIGGVDVAASEVDALAAQLQSEGASFFVFPDCTFLYAATGAPSPQPLVWFHKGLTYPFAYSEALDRRIVASLRKHDVRTIVLESESFFGTQARLDDFPLLKAYIAAEFVLAADPRFGMFRVHRRRPPAALGPETPSRGAPPLEAAAPRLPSQQAKKGAPAVR